MPNPNALVDGISSLSPSQEVLAAAALEALPQTVTVNFEGGQSALLDLTIPHSRVWAEIFDSRRQTKKMVYVEIDPETNIITELLIPRAVRVGTLTPIAEGDVEVELIISAALHYLRQSNPNFQEMLDALQSAQDERSALLVTETLYEHEIIDVRPLPESLAHTAPPMPPDPSSDPPPDPPVTPQRAQELFDLVNAKSCDPVTAPAPCIPFLYPDDGCYARAHEMCRLMINESEQPEKIWIYGSLKVETSNNPNCEVNWWYHVAPTLLVDMGTGTEIRVIDPSLFPLGPVSENQWKSVQGDPSATLEYSDASIYFKTPGDTTGITDPNYTQTQDDLDFYRTILKLRCADYGPPPYSCPIVKNCFIILDRSTFGEDEITAMLQQSAPAVISAAFYVVVDGFKPTDLGITASTFTDPPNVIPNLQITPAVPGMSVDATHLAAEDPLHLMRRQRLTWTCKVEFTDTSGFGFSGDEQPVTLTASISGVSGSATIQLIKQPNPYMVDGATSWLSTDLRVFQIKAGDSKFGVTMGNTPAEASDFIKQVITNLNTGNTGGQTFENDISTDQQTSKLELSMNDVNGTPVFNFAVAQVRYRGMLDAQNVRVFFRLFPVSTTSLVYEQSTAYRRGGQAGVTIPLLGIQGSNLTTIPFFAEPRIETSIIDMNAQTDPANVQEILHDATGAEVKAYFGCWLDINQLQQHFPIQPSPPDGPFTSDRKSIQELVRNRHQCIVAEIAFDPAPIPSGATPGSSDKLSQRNLSIVESPNPGEFASRRIPNTFEIQPSQAKLLPGEIPDELMIHWGNTPVGSLATLYLSGINVADVLEMAVKMYGTHRLVPIDDHTLQCRTGGVTYIPIPPGKDSFTGMLTVDLPATVKEGQVFTIVVRQVTSVSRGATRPIKWRRILGSYQITIPVRTKEMLLEPEEHQLSVLRWIQGAIPEDNRWFPVFSRYEKQIASRVDAFGGNSSEVLPSPSGDWKEPKDIIMQVEGDVHATFESREAGFENEFWLYKPKEKLIFKATNENVGKKFKVGHYRAGTRLVFVLKAQDGNTYYTDRSLNQDGCDHVIRTKLTKYAYRYEWEDMWELGDRDFNDLVVKINITRPR